MGERIFRTGQQEDSREATSSSDTLGSPTLYGDNILGNASKTSSNPTPDVKMEVSRDEAYAVARAGPTETSGVDRGAGSEEDEGRRRHDLFVVSGTHRPAHLIPLIRRYSVPPSAVMFPQ